MAPVELVGPMAAYLRAATVQVVGIPVPMRAAARVVAE